MKHLTTNGVRPFFRSKWMYSTGVVNYFLTVSSQSLGVYPPHLYEYERIRETIDQVTWVLGSNPNRVLKLKRINRRKQCITMVG